MSQLQPLVGAGSPDTNYGAVGSGSPSVASGSTSEIIQWTVHYSDEVKRVYWYNRFTGATTYDRPMCLSTPVGVTVPPNSWIENKDEQGRPYYGNGNESSWSMPEEYRVWKEHVDTILASAAQKPQSAESKMPVPAPAIFPANRLVQVFKNERYGMIPPPGKWSEECLLLTDRLQLSDDLGFEGWETLEEVTDAYDLRDPGWNWEPGSSWTLDKTSRDVDRDGWQYSSDFPGKGRAMSHWHGKKMPTHWVRRQRYTRQQVFDQVDYDREIVEFQQKEREKREKADLYRKNPGLAIKDGFNDFRDYCKKQEQKLVENTKKLALEIQGFPGKVIEDVASKAIEDYVTNPLLDMQRTETNELMRYVDEGKDSWRFAGFVCSLLLVVVSLLSVFVNILQLNPPYALLNCFTMAFGVVSMSLEYKNHWLTKDLVALVKKEAKFLSAPYGRASFYVFVGLLLACEGYVLDFVVGLLLVAVGSFIFYSSWKMYRALAAFMTPTLSRLQVLRQFRQIAGRDNVIDSAELVQLFMALGQQLNKYEIETVLFALDENGDGRISEAEFCFYWKKNMGFSDEPPSPAQAHGETLQTTLLTAMAVLGVAGLVGFSVYRNALSVFAAPSLFPPPPAHATATVSSSPRR